MNQSRENPFSLAKYNKIHAALAMEKNFMDCRRVDGIKLERADVPSHRSKLVVPDFSIHWPVLHQDYRG